MNEKLVTGWLLSFYGPLLTERQQKLLALYCEEDFSLTEIAQREGISRQGVYDTVRKGARQLESYEQLLGLAERYRRLTEGLEAGLDALRDAPGDKAQQAREILARLLSQEEE